MPAVFLTAYRCTTESLDVCTHFLQALVQIFQQECPCWDRFFFMPLVRGDPTVDEKERFTQTTLDLVDVLNARSQQGTLWLHSFGRDGSAKFAYPRSYLTKAFLAEVVQGLFHVNSFVWIRSKLEKQFNSQDVAVKVSKRSRSGRGQLSEEDVRMLHFFSAKLNFIERYCFSAELVKKDWAETSPVEGLRCGVDVERVEMVASEWLNYWAFPLAGAKPQGLERMFMDYLAALDEGLWCLLQHHRLLPSLPQLVQRMVDTLPVEEAQRLPMALAWLQNHDKTKIVSS
ncbi:unnamed protein product [Durusdinium trenchii]|uniref:Uncharacterized protein n=2 Tax=Durusdinium trenchii TaxID=1381693 RepID=A0ABP0KNE8_9DINO